jgi:hypothetical protein
MYRYQLQKIISQMIGGRYVQEVKKEETKALNAANVMIWDIRINIVY